MMDVHYLNGEIYINKILIGTEVDNVVVVHIQDDQLFSLKASFVKSLRQYVTNIKLQKYCITVIIDAFDLPIYIRKIETNYETFLHDLLTDADDELVIEVRENGKIKAVGDIVSIHVGKQKNDNLIIKLNSLYNQFIKDAVISFITDNDEFFYVIAKEDRIILSPEETFIDELNELFDE